MPEKVGEFIDGDEPLTDDEFDTVYIYHKADFFTAFWVIKRVGAGALFLCGMAILAWLVLELSDTLREALVTIGLVASFLVGHVLVGEFGDRT